VDDAWFTIVAVVRAIGATGVVQGAYRMGKRNGVSGFGNDEPGDVKAALSTGFDMTVANIQAGISVNNGASAAWTFQVVAAELLNVV
jgi:hypothetical protein